MTQHLQGQNWFTWEVGNKIGGKFQNAIDRDFRTRPKSIGLSTCLTCKHARMRQVRSGQGFELSLFLSCVPSYPHILTWYRVSCRIIWIFLEALKWNPSFRNVRRPDLDKKAPFLESSFDPSFNYMGSSLDFHPLLVYVSVDSFHLLSKAMFSIPHEFS